MNRNPFILTQNRLVEEMVKPDFRLTLYRSVLQRRFDRALAGENLIKIPKMQGLNQRVPGMPFHSTPEFFFQEGGRTRYSLPGESFVLKPGAALLIPAGMPHHEQRFGPFFLNLIVMFQPESFSIHLGTGNRWVNSPIDVFRSTGRFALQRYAEELASEAVAPRVKHGLYLTVLARLLEGIVPTPAKAKQVSPRDALVERCREMIDLQSTQVGLSVIMLAQQLGCSPDHLSRHFRAKTGERVLEAVHRRQIEHARQLLRDSTMNIAEIAWACGFTRPSHFNRLFRKLTGTTPGVMRGAKKETNG